jgi:predicted HTH domain antitoxin
MSVITIELPDEVFASARCDPMRMAREMRVATAITWYEQGRISQEIAALMMGLDRVEFLLELARRGRDSFQVDFVDLDRELARG